MSYKTINFDDYNQYNYELKQDFILTCKDFIGDIFIKIQQLISN